MQYITLLFRKHKKHLPKKLQSTWFGELCRFGFMIFLSAWILQGIRIMNWREATLKVALTVIPTAIRSEERRVGKEFRSRWEPSE